MNNTFTKINMNIPYKLSSKRNNSTKMAKNNLLNREKNKENLVFKAYVNFISFILLLAIAILILPVEREEESGFVSI